MHVALSREAVYRVAAMEFQSLLCFIIVQLTAVEGQSISRYCKDTIRYILHNTKFLYIISCKKIFLEVWSEDGLKMGKFTSYIAIAITHFSLSL